LKDQTTRMYGRLNLDPTKVETQRTKKSCPGQAGAETGWSKVINGELNMQEVILDLPAAPCVRLSRLKINGNLATHCAIKL